MRVDEQPALPRPGVDWSSWSLALLRQLTDYLRRLAQQVNLISEGRMAGQTNALTAPPTTGAWAIGDVIRNSNCTATGGDAIYGWLCVASGEPGTWVEIHCAGTGGAGTVTSVAQTVPAEFAIAGSPVTTTGTLAITKATQTANYVWAGPTTGSAAQPTFRALVAGDMPAGVGSTAGKHEVSVVAEAMRPSATGGCGYHTVIASGADKPDICYLPFDATTEEYAQFSVPMPKSWDEGTVTFRPIWSHAATTSNYDVVWELQAVAISNAEAMAASYGTAQSSTDVGGTTDYQYTGPDSSAITVAGTPAAGDVVHFRIGRRADNSNKLAIDARLHGIVLSITTDASNDA